MEVRKNKPGQGRKPLVQNGKDYAFRMGDEEIQAIDAWQESWGFRTRSEALRSMVAWAAANPVDGPKAFRK